MLLEARWAGLGGAGPVTMIDKPKHFLLEMKSNMHKILAINWKNPFLFTQFFPLHEERLR
jgi:hypothetical protein